VSLFSTSAYITRIDRGLHRFVRAGRAFFSFFMSDDRPCTAVGPRPSFSSILGETSMVVTHFPRPALNRPASLRLIPCIIGPPQSLRSFDSRPFDVPPSCSFFRPPPYLGLNVVSAPQTPEPQAKSLSPPPPPFVVVRFVFCSFSLTFPWLPA